jgi:Icc-related predicted phosphoesterase
MRVAVLNDVHANLPALEAVLEEVRDERADIVLFGGDVIPGPMTRETLAQVLQLEIPSRFIHGNGELAVLARIGARDPKAVGYTGTTAGAPLPEPAREIIRWTANEGCRCHEQLSDDGPGHFGRGSPPGRGGGNGSFGRTTIGPPNVLSPNTMIS